MEKFFAAVAGFFTAILPYLKDLLLVLAGKEWQRIINERNKAKSDYDSVEDWERVRRTPVEQLRKQSGKR
jgi:hypothetical protein